MLRCLPTAPHHPAGATRLCQESAGPLTGSQNALTSRRAAHVRVGDASASEGPVALALEFTEKTRLIATPKSAWRYQLRAGSAANEGGGDEASPDKGARQASDGRGRRCRPVR